MPSSHNAPPATLDCALEVGPDSGGTRLLSAVDCPGGPAAGGLDFDDFEERSAQPRALLLLQPDGKQPPYVAFGSTGVKDSLQNLRDVPEFVANIVTMHLLER